MNLEKMFDSYTMWRLHSIFQFHFDRDFCSVPTWKIEVLFTSQRICFFQSQCAAAVTAFSILNFHSFYIFLPQMHNFIHRQFTKRARSKLLVFFWVFLFFFCAKLSTFLILLEFITTRRLKIMKAFSFYFFFTLFVVIVFCFCVEIL